MRNNTAPAPGNERHTTCPQPREQLLVGWITGGTAMTTGASPVNNDRSDWLDLAPPLPPCEHWLTVMVGGATGPRPQVRRAQDDAVPTTRHPHCRCKQLLAGWIGGARRVMMDNIPVRTTRKGMCTLPTPGYPYPYPPKTHTLD
jgi:hypothetical protein